MQPPAAGPPGESAVEASRAPLARPFASWVAEHLGEEGDVDARTSAL